MAPIDAGDERLGATLGASVVERVPAEPPVRWAVVVHAEDGSIPSRIVWAEEVDPTAIGDAPSGATDAAMVIGVETLLPDPERADPIRAWLEISRQLWEIGADGPLLDPATGRWFERGLRERWIADPSSSPAEELLWSVRATRRRGAGGVWLTTEGLSRIGRAELELVETPEELADAGAALLDSLAGLACESPPPMGVPWSIGPALDVAVRTPEEVLETVAESSAGSTAHRDGRVPIARGGEIDSLVVCGAEPRGRYRRIWTSPIEVLQAVAKGAAVHRSRRSAARCAHLAQRHLGSVDDALGSPGKPRVLLAGATEDESVVWGVVVQTLGDRWSVQPLDLEGRPAAGTPEILLRRDQVCDWRVERDGGMFGPDDVEDLAGRTEGGAAARPLRDST